MLYGIGLTIIGMCIFNIGLTYGLSKLGGNAGGMVPAAFMGIDAIENSPLYRYGVGLHYRVGDPWLLRFGLNYDTSPTDASDRTADLPVDTQLRFGAGFQNQRGEKFSYGVELLYADLGDAPINSSGPLGDLVGVRGRAVRRRRPRAGVPDRAHRGARRRTLDRRGLARHSRQRHPSWRDQLESDGSDGVRFERLLRRGRRQ